MLIDTTYFYGPCKVAQLTEDSVVEHVTGFIESYEPPFLECLLGYNLYKELTDAITADPTLAQPANLKYKQIRDGVTEYVDKYGNKQRYKGLLFTQGTTKKSPIANYVYFYLLRDSVTNSTGTGEKKIDGENATNASVIAKQWQRWNEMVEWNKELRLYLQSNTVTYDTWADPLMRPVYKLAKDVFHTNNGLNL